MPTIRISTATTARTGQPGQRNTASRIPLDPSCRGNTTYEPITTECTTDGMGDGSSFFAAAMCNNDGVTKFTDYVTREQIPTHKENSFVNATVRVGTENVGLTNSGKQGAETEVQSELTLTAEFTGEKPTADTRTPLKLEQKPGGPNGAMLNRWIANFDGTLTCIVKVKNAATKVKYNNGEVAFGVKGKLDLSLVAVVPTVSFDIATNETWANETKHKYTAGTDFSTPIAVKAGDDITGKCEALFTGANGQIAQAMKSVRDKVKVDFEYRFKLPDEIVCDCRGYAWRYAVCAFNAGDWSICAGRDTDPGPLFKNRPQVGAYYFSVPYIASGNADLVRTCRDYAKDETTIKKINDVCMKPQYYPADGVGNVCKTDVTGWPKACQLFSYCGDTIGNHECFLRAK